jgi:hypothetical protein
MAKEARDVNLKARPAKLLTQKKTPQEGNSAGVEKTLEKRTSGGSPCRYIAISGIVSNG